MQVKGKRKSSKNRKASADVDLYSPEVKEGESDQNHSIEDSIEAKLLLDQSAHNDTYGEFKLNPTAGRFAYDLFDEKRGEVVEKVVHVRRVSLPGGGERWKIFADTKLVFTLEGSKLLKKEREFLRSPPGFNFLIQQGKSEIKSVNQFKKSLKEVLHARKSV